MHSRYFLLILGCWFLVSCGDKTPNNQATSPDLPAQPTTPAATTSSAAPNPNTGTASNSALPMLAGTPAIAGSGCAEGTTQLEFQPQQASFKLSINALELGTAQGQKTNLTCNLAIPVTVPTGYQVSIVPLHFAGSLTGNGLKLELRREYFFAGTTGTPEVSSLALPTDSQFNISDSVNNEDTLQWSSCGQDTNIRVNTRLLIKGGEGQAKLTISSTDPTEPSLFKLNYRACN
ncbi:DUF4360 domain-containing protein [uncultured Thiothrix sp.]|uniref:DUF4360 domain-containing protein n=1 Tax=uncultured Thiothrix sp. TaxID=223185 RepID=UPI0026204DD0|nr:DUF4360 domain-containing protein [uncultured Thiothrix sp.]